MPYSNKVHTVLLPERDILRRVLLQEDTADDIIPANQWLIDTKKSRDSLIPYVGCLTLIKRAQISNWFEKHVANNQHSMRHLWLGRLPIAHAGTIYITAISKSTTNYRALSKEKLLQKDTIDWSSMTSHGH